MFGHVHLFSVLHFEFVNVSQKLVTFIHNLVLIELYPCLVMTWHVTTYQSDNKCHMTCISSKQSYVHDDEDTEDELYLH